MHRFVLVSSMGVLLSAGVALSQPATPAGKTKATWWGHAAWIIETPGGARIAIDGRDYKLPNTDILWYVTATHTASGRTLRMPFYLRAIAYVSPVVTAAPTSQRSAPFAEKTLKWFVQKSTIISKSWRWL